MNLGTWLFVALPIVLIAGLVIAFRWDRIPVNIIPDWRGAWKLLSMHVAAIWSLIFGALVADPSLVVNLWNGLPADLKPDLPGWAKAIIIAATVLATFAGAKLVKQPVLRPEDQKP